tara:strand:- start:221 stop:823 length:603 start_codon:yes stop_codon:yes gene_type:complete
MAFKGTTDGKFQEGYTGEKAGYTGPGMPDISRVSNPRQPDNNNYLSSNYFQIEITRLPTVTYFCQSASIPSLSLTPVEQPTAFGLRPKFVGGQYAFEDLVVNFIVDEQMKNWYEVYEWMKSIGNMERYSDTIDRTQTGDFFSDITLTVTNSAYKPQYYVRFTDAFPIGLSSLEFNSTSTENEPILASATFSYTSYDISNI